MSVAVGRIGEEGRALLQEVARREPAKVLARITGKTPRHIYNLRDGECETGWLTFVALARHAPDLGAWLLRQMGVGEEAIITTADEAAFVEAALKAYRQQKQTGAHD